MRRQLVYPPKKYNKNVLTFFKQGFYNLTISFFFKFSKLWIFFGIPLSFLAIKLNHGYLCSYFRKNNSMSFDLIPWSTVSMAKAALGYRPASEPENVILFHLKKKQKKTKKNKHIAELQRTDPGTKVTGEFSTRGHIFSPNVWNEFLSFPSL